jgi:hypothetical protein
VRADTKGHERVYRTAHQVVIGWVLAAAATAVGVLVLLLPGAHRHGGYAIAAVAFLAAVGLARFARCGVYVSTGGVRVRNLLRTTDLAWAQIKEFKLSAAGSSQIALENGKWISIVGIQQTNLDWMTKRHNTSARQLIADLNELLTEARR